MKLYVPAGVTFSVIEPLAPTHEVLGAGVPDKAMLVLLFETVALAVVVQPLAFVAVTV